MWRCPKCEHEFVTTNLWHSCGRYPLEDHFAKRDPIVRTLFDHLVTLFERCGPVTVYAQKSRIVLQVRVRFAAVRTTRHTLDGHLWLKRDAAHPRIHRVERLPPDNYIHNFRFTALDQFDRAFERLAREAYGVGEQRHLVGRRRNAAGTRVSLPGRGA